MKFLIVFILLTIFSAYPQNEYPIESELGKLLFMGNYATTDSLMDRIIIKYPRLINFRISPTWKPRYPNPGSPSMSPPSAFVLYDTSAIQIELLDKEEMNILKFVCTNNPKGYYIFHINSYLQVVDSLNLSPRDCKLRLILNDTTYTVPLIPY